MAYYCIEKMPKMAQPAASAGARARRRAEGRAPYGITYNPPHLYAPTLLRLLALRTRSPHLSNPLHSRCTKKHARRPISALILHQDPSRLQCVCTDSTYDLTVEQGYHHYRLDLSKGTTGKPSGDWLRSGAALAVRRVLVLTASVSTDASACASASASCHACGSWFSQGVRQ